MGHVTLILEAHIVKGTRRRKAWKGYHKLTPWFSKFSYEGLILGQISRSEITDKWQRYYLKLLLQRAKLLFRKLETLCILASIMQECLPPFSLSSAVLSYEFFLPIQ